MSNIYRVEYVSNVHGKLYRAVDDLNPSLTIALATKLVKLYSRRGMTAWVIDANGAHVPVPGAMRVHPTNANLPTWKA